MIAKIAGRVRGLFAGNYPENREEEQWHITPRGEELACQALPERTEILRMGNSYIAIATAAAPVATIPTTAAPFQLWNGELDNGYCYVIDAVGAFCAVSAAAAINVNMAVQLNTGRYASPAGAIVPKSLCGKPYYRGKGNVKAGSTTVTDEVIWHNVGNTLVCALTATLGLSIEAPCYGRYIVPPGGMFNVTVLCNAAGSSTFSPWVIWHEIQLVRG